MDVFALALRISETGSNAALNAMERLEHQGHQTSEAVDKVGERLEFLAVAAAAVTAAFGFEKIVEATGAAQQANLELQGSVENAGASWKAWNPILDEVAETMLGKTRFGVDETKKALGNLITITGDVRKAYADIGLAADIAAKKHMDLGEAATLVGRVQEGNTGMLVRYGIVVKAGGDAMQELRDKFGGFAEKEGAGLADSLTRSKNLLEELSKTVGENVFGTDLMTGAVNGFNKAILAGMEWVKANKVELQAIGEVLTSIGSRIAKGAEVAVRNLWQAFGEGQAIIIALVANVDQMPERFKRALGASLMALGDFGASAGTVVDRLFGTDLASRADALANAGSRMMIEGNRQLNFIGTAARETINEILAGTTAAEHAAAQMEKLPGGGAGADRGLTAAQLEDQKKQVEAFKELTALHAINRSDVMASMVLEQKLNAELASGTLDREQRAEVLKQLHELQQMGLALGGEEIVQIQQQALAIGDVVKETMKGIHPIVEPKVVFAEDAMDAYAADMMQQLEDAFDAIGPRISGGLAKTLGAAMTGGFHGAKDVALVALGGIFTEMGTSLMTAGFAMIKLLPALSNPFTSGPAMIATGAVLFGLGAALAATAHGSGGGGSSSGAYGGGAGGGFGGYDDYTRVTLNGTTARGASQVTPVAPVTNHFTVIGADSPTAQRQIVELVNGAIARGHALRGI